MLQFKDFETSSFWEFLDPDTGYRHIGGDRKELIQNIVNYRSNNKLEPIERLDLVLEHYLCSQAKNCGKCKEVPLKRGLLQYIKGGIALVQNILYSSFVEDNVAEERAAICIKCACNCFPDNDLFLKWADNIALHSVGDKRVSVQEQLGSCLGCSCVMKAKVWYPGPFNLAPDEEQIMRACNSNCWQLNKE